MSDIRSRLRSFDGTSTPSKGVPPPQPNPSEKPKSAPQMVPLQIEEPVSYDFSDISSKNKKKKGKKIALITLIVVLVGLFLAGAGYGGYWLYKNKIKKTVVVVEKPKTSTNNTATPTAKTVRFVATGDMIPHSAILARADKGNGTYDFAPMLANMKPFYEKANVRFCSQATPSGGTALGISGYPVFNAPVEWPKALETIGCNVIGLATNNMNDKGQAGIDATVAAWDNKAGIAVAGANRSVEEQNKMHFFESNKVGFGYLAYTTSTNNKTITPHGLNIYTDELAQKQVKEARAKSDILIVSMHWGTEQSPDITADQDAKAQALADMGADVIVGHGAHVLQPVKRLKGKSGNETLVWYSLGNSLNAQLEIESLIGGFAVMDINTATKRITAVSFMPTYTHYEWTPAQKASQNLLARTNFSMYPLDKAAEPLAKSLNNTTVEAQTARVTAVLNKFTTIPIITSAQY